MDFDEIGAKTHLPGLEIAGGEASKIKDLQGECTNP
jgi:hypothetical protein